jgi:hypothetical protein
MASRYTSVHRASVSAEASVSTGWRRPGSIHAAYPLKGLGGSVK